MLVVDHVLILTEELLKSSDLGFSKAIQHLLSNPTGYELRQPMRPKFRSVGAVDMQGKTCGLIEWLEKLRAEGPLFANIHDFTASIREGMPAHIEAAFANGHPKVLQIKSQHQHKTYSLRTLFSPQKWLTFPLFREFINAQKNPSAHWDMICSEVNSANELNGREAVAREEVEEYLVAESNAAWMDFYLPQLVRGMQVVAKNSGIPLRIPGELSKYFETFDPDQQALDYLKANEPENVIEFVPSDRICYFGSAKSRDLVELVNAQASRDDIWQRIARHYNELKPQDHPERSPESLSAFFETLDDEAFQNLFPSSYMSAIQSSCARHGSEMVVPEHLRSAVKLQSGIDDPEIARNYIPERELLLLVANPEPWEFYAFVEVQGFGEATKITDASQIESDFTSNLEKAEEFARRHESGFAEAFRLSRFVLQTRDLRFEGNRTALMALAHDLTRFGFTERSQRVLERELDVISEFVELFGWKDAKTRRVLAAGVANVFGGMGSWNDLGFESASDQEEYERLSTQLFGALQKFSTIAWQA